MITIRDSSMEAMKPDFMHPEHRLVREILMKVVYPIQFVPTISLEDLNKTLIVMLELTIKRLYNEQFIRFNTTVNSEFYDTNITAFYDEITYSIMKTVSSRFVLGPLLFYMEKPEIYHYIKTMIVAKHAKKLVEDIREEVSAKTNLDKDFDKIDRITELTTNLITAFVISYDIDQVKYLAQELVNIEYAEKTQAINNAITSSSYIIPIFIQRLLTNPNLIPRMETEISNYFHRASRFHTKEGFIELYKSVSEQTPDIMERIEITRQNRNSYHNLTSLRLIDKLSIEELRILHAIIAEQSIEQYKSAIESNTILTNIKAILERSRSIEDSVILNNHEVIIRAPNGNEKRFNYHDEKLAHKLNNPMQMFGPMARYYEDDPSFWRSEKSALMATGLLKSDFNKALQSKHSTVLKRNRDQRVVHRKQMIYSLEQSIKDESVLNKAKLLRSNPIREFKYAQPSYSNVFYKNTPEELYLALVELDQAYEQIKLIKGG